MVGGRARPKAGGRQAGGADALSRAYLAACQSATSNNSECIGCSGHANSSVMRNVRVYIEYMGRVQASMILYMVRYMYNLSFDGNAN